MRVQRIDHLHAYAKDVDAVARLFSDLFGMKCRVCDYPQFGGRTCAIRPWQSSRFIEFVQPTDANGVLGRLVGPRDEGLLCVNFKVPDLEKAIKDMEARGINTVRRSESVSGRVKQAWFECKDTFGVQFELSQYAGDNMFAESGNPLVQDF